LSGPRIDSRRCGAVTNDIKAPEHSSSLWDLQRIFIATVGIECCLLVIAGRIQRFPQGVGGFLERILLIGPFLALAYPGARCLMARKWREGLLFILLAVLLGFVVLLIAWMTLLIAAGATI
jgi:hypothetical protein